MTEAELLELFELAAANAFTAFTMYLTVMTAYVVTAYFVGNKLSFAQVVLAGIRALHIQCIRQHSSHNNVTCKRRRLRKCGEGSF